MKPERENSFVDLLDRIVTKGVVLNADLIISVAGIPLLGVNLKAALAGIETMLDYGMMEAWDQSTREWYAKEFTKIDIPLINGEKILNQTFGSIWYDQGIIQTWRPGLWYLTSKRLFLWRKEPGEVLFEVHIEKIKTVELNIEIHMGQERSVLTLQLEHSKAVSIHVYDVIQYKDIIENAINNFRQNYTDNVTSLHEQKEIWKLDEAEVRDCVITSA